jgi:predicted acylesterase/phospholipase RssA
MTQAKNSSTQSSSNGQFDRELPPLDPLQRPPVDRYCDVVLDGGVINGVVYPGFLVELARKFHFHALAGTSVGAIAAALAAACEYSRRYGRDTGFNEGLAKMPGELAEWVDEDKTLTRIRSLFQPDPKVRPLFDFFVDWLGVQMEKTPNNLRTEKEEKTDGSAFPSASFGASHPHGLMWNIFRSAGENLGPNIWQMLIWMLVAIAPVYLIDINHPVKAVLIWLAAFWAGTLFVHPFVKLMFQVRALYRLEGFGACSGMRASKSTLPGLTEWMHEGIQKSAGLPLHSPLTFADLWAAPGAPSATDQAKEARSIDFRTITTCLSHGRIYELPQAPDEQPSLFFRLSEFSRFFPKDIIDHLRRVSQPIEVSRLNWLRRQLLERRMLLEKDTNPTVLQRDQFSAKAQASSQALDEAFRVAENLAQGLLEPDLRLLPREQMPILVAVRLSMSCPILFACVPLVGINRDTQPEDAKLTRLWFSDGGIGSNFPVHLFDKAIPRWPTFALRILDQPPRNGSNDYPMQSYIPYFHRDGVEDNLLYPRDDSAFSTLVGGKATLGSFLKLIFSIYTSAKDGNDQSFGRMPDVRNRVMRLYLNSRAGNMLNLKLAPELICNLALGTGARSGRNAAQAYLQEIPSKKYDWVSAWMDHRWVRMNMLIHGLRDYLDGVGIAMTSPGLPGTRDARSLLKQLDEAIEKAPLASPNDDSEVKLSLAQVAQLRLALEAIRNLEQTLGQLDNALPYKPSPMPDLQFKPRV